MALVGKAVRPACHRAYTLAELLVALFVIALLVFVLLPALVPCRNGSSRQIKCGTQVRNIIQAMTIFAQGNRDSYPLPSILDANNAAVSAADPREKDTTNNILSILVFNSSISPELLCSPAETNSSIKVFADYQAASPKAAVRPADALWDPSLRCDFTTGDGHVSCATLMPSGDCTPGVKSRGRLAMWGNTFNATEAVVANRGPLVAGLDRNGEPIHNRNSNTMAIHGGRTTWEGNVGYNDNHVNFETCMNPGEITYRSADGKRKVGTFYYDEPDDAAAVNAYLGIWVRAGSLPQQFKGIHD
ncbi:MAG TPA: type II secretion system protein [Phycisphaerales bacterium]|nr:type II secretion system protein [Phycisphaerales bacterium]